MDYLEKGSPVRQNIRQDVYNSTNFVGRVDAQSLESKSISTESLDIDFTDTLSYVSSDNSILNIGEIFISGIGWISIESEGDFIGSSFENDDILIQSGEFDVEWDSGMGVLPVFSSGEYFKLKSGDYEGSSLSNSITKDPSGNIFSGVHFNVKEGADNRRYQIHTGVSSGVDEIYIAKTNEAGEVVVFEINELLNGFKLSNTLSDNTASVLKIEDNNGDAILEFFNDYLVSETIPALDYAVDAAAALGGVPIGGIYHNSGTIRIRLT